MSKVTVVIASTTETALPAGDTFAGYQYSILNGPHVVQQATTTDLTLAFPNDVPAGSYTASVVAVDPNGAALGAAVTADFTVVASTPTFLAPASLTVQVQ